MQIDFPSGDFNAYFNTFNGEITKLDAQYCKPNYGFSSTTTAVMSCEADP